MDLAQLATRHLFFTGKGGVGKTSVACATAVKFADMGKRVLLVSTDPASNLDEVLGSELGTRPTPVRGVPGLFALNLDPETAAKAYRDRVVGPYRSLLPPAAVASMEEQLSGACTVEIAAFDEFAKLLGDKSATAEFDHVLFDTAPTGHTLRLLTLPSAWTGFVEQSAFGTSCLGPLAGLEKQRALYESTVRALGDPAATTMVLVTRPEASALAEAARTNAELAALGVRNQRLVVNAVFEVEGDDLIALALAQRGCEALAAMPVLLRGLPRTTLPLRPAALVGIDALRRFDAPVVVDGDADDSGVVPLHLPSLETLIDELAANPRGVILTMGKGGVGKTTIAAAIAVELARRGLQVRLSTTDPAAHVADAVGSPPPGLTVSRIDPVAETRAYRAEVLATVGAQLDEKGRALLDEDLRSESVRGLLPRLRDPAFTRVLLVTLPEATPVHEAQALQGDLARADIAPFAWVVNQSLAPVATRDPVLAARSRAERPFLDEVRALSRRWAVVPWVAEPPRGAERLATLSGQPGMPAPRAEARR